MQQNDTNEGKLVASSSFIDAHCTGRLAAPTVCSEECKSKTMNGMESSSGVVHSPSSYNSFSSCGVEHSCNGLRKTAIDEFSRACADSVTSETNTDSAPATVSGARECEGASSVTESLPVGSDLASADSPATPAASLAVGQTRSAAKGFGDGAVVGRRLVELEETPVVSPTMRSEDCHVRRRVALRSSLAEAEFPAKTTRTGSVESHVSGTQVIGEGIAQTGSASLPTPRHWSLFYPDGIEAQPPVLLHYLMLGGWRTIAGGWDYFLHRRLDKGEVVGHTVRWLHGAKPRDRFVFLIGPVGPKPKNEPTHMWRRMVDKLFGIPPSFAYSKGELRKHSGSASSSSSYYSYHSSAPVLDDLVSGDGRPGISGDDTLHSDQSEQSAKASVRSATAARDGKQGLHKKYGVEVIEIRHEDVTALDYGPRLLTSRFAIEAKAVYAYYFSSVEEAYAYYDCVDHIRSVEKKEKQGIARAVPFGQNAQSAIETEGKGMGNSGQPVSGRWGSTGATSLASDTSYDLCDIDDPRHSKEYEEENTLLPTYSLPQESLPDHSGLLQPVQTSQSQSGLLPYRARVFPALTTVHCDTIVTIYTGDPNFNAILGELLIPEPGTHPYTVSVREQRRMLSMYETGMPAWTIFLASTGLPYRRVFRLTFVGLLNIWPVISLFVGLYDLYKHLPQMKNFLSTTLEPLLDWIEEHVTLRVSMLVTYIFSVGLTVVASFTSFFSQFYLLELFLLPIRMFVHLLQLPLALLVDVVWALFRTVSSFLSLLWVTFKLLIAGPFVLVTHLGSLEFAGYGATVLPAAAQGTSLSLKWWRAWQEFWVTVASPVKNLAKAWYDSVAHVAMKAAKHDASIRRWVIPKLLTLLGFFEVLRESCVIYFRKCWHILHSDHGQLFTHAVLLFFCVWILLRFPGDRTEQTTGSWMGNWLPGIDMQKGKVDQWPPPPVQEELPLLLPAPPRPLLPGLREQRDWDVVRDPQEDLLRGPRSRSFDEYDNLHFAWETLLAIWIQLPW